MALASVAHCAQDLLELYCGCGSHTVALAPFFRQVWELGGWCPPWWPPTAKVLSVEINRHLVEAAQHHGSDQRCWGENLVEVAINTLYIVYMCQIKASSLDIVFWKIKRHKPPELVLWVTTMEAAWDHDPTPIPPRHNVALNGLSNVTVLRAPSEDFPSGTPWPSLNGCRIPEISSFKSVVLFSPTNPWAATLI